MCGIFGLFAHRDSDCTPRFIRRSLSILAQLSESRGKDSSGLALRNEADRELTVIKGTVALSDLLERETVASQVERLIRACRGNAGGGQRRTFAVMGHSRLVTNGSQLVSSNNQPVVKGGMLGIHNGIIVNESKLWSLHPELERAYEIDTEVMLALIRKYLGNGQDVATAISRTAAEIVGTFSISLLAADLNMLALATNNGSLYTLTDGRGLFAFASEEYFLKELARRMRLGTDGACAIRPVVSDHGVVLDLENFRLQEFSFAVPSHGLPQGSLLKEPYRIVVDSITNGGPLRELILDPAKIAVSQKASSEAALLEYNLQRLRALRRCSNCLLPETFPFIEFHERGTCNYCIHYTIKNQPKPIDELLEIVRPYRRTDGGHDCIVPYSGGRDSTHTLHVVKNVLKLNPIAFTYDWGMVNDLARRNIARVCGKLKVENVIVAADISWKRENIRKNILAWLRRPDLGMVPLFMAGDKFFFYYADQVKKRTGVRLNIWGINPLENTDFKVGFLGVPPDHQKERIYSLSLGRQGKLFWNIAKRVVENPGYLNSSVWDTLGSFVSRSIVPHRDYYHLYDYYRWDEQEIENLVRDEYHWETAIDTRTTWRIGDGTAAFYNYVYCTVAGFSEYDTFRSNQIREGALSREEGLYLIEEENRPRYASIKWYTDIVNLDFATVINRINGVPKLYS